ncbi:MAG: carboxypeptidase-like regulatory domain-containing protein [Pirellula sp.]
MMRNSSFSFHVAAILYVGVLCPLFTGCGEMTVAPVSGTITLDGVPLKRASITFHPEAGGRPSFGVSNDNGEYTLGYSMSKTGAEVGPCRVTISTKIEGDDGKPAKELVPARYAKEPIVVKVESRSNKIDLKLTSK